MQTKNLTVTEMADSGKGLALIAKLSEIDHDNDTYEKGAFAWKGDQWCPLLTAHDRWRMPFGKARVFEQGDAAYAELHLNLDTQIGKEWHSTLKFDLAHGKAVQEWSYGFDAVEATYRINSGEDRVRVLKRLDVHEVSAVVRGAGRGTQTLDMKTLKAALKQGEFKALTEQLGTMAAVLEADPTKLSATGLKQLKDIHASLGAALVLANRDDADEAKAAAEIEQLHTSFLAGDAIREAQRRFR
ncbi:MAG: HK97 family phage prohead protease [Pseudomonadota bacterium]